MKLSLRAIFLTCFGVAVAALIAATHLATSAPAGKGYEVACVSGGMPSFQSKAEHVRFSGGLWVFEIQGVEYRTNLECAVRQAQ